MFKNCDLLLYVCICVLHSISPLPLRKLTNKPIKPAGSPSELTLEKQDFRHSHPVVWDSKRVHCVGGLKVTWPTELDEEESPQLPVFPQLPVSPQLPVTQGLNADLQFCYSS